MKRKQILSGVVALLLWSGTSILGLLEIPLFGRMAVAISLALQGVDPQRDPLHYSIPRLETLARLVAGLVIGVFIMVSLGYHYNNLGQRKSWKLFAWTAAVELAILVVYGMFAWFRLL